MYCIYIASLCRIIFSFIIIIKGRSFDQFSIYELIDFTIMIVLCSVVISFPFMIYCMLIIQKRDSKL